MTVMKKFVDVNFELASMKLYFIYMMSNKHNNVLYTGITSNLKKRVWQHKEHINTNSFTSKYNVNKLLYYETYPDPKQAIAREKQLKNYRREK